jgi:hypothetical protein
MISMWPVLKWTDKIIAVLIWINFIYLLFNIYLVIGKKVIRIYKSNKIIILFIVIQIIVLTIQQLTSLYDFIFLNIPKKAEVPGIDIFNRSTGDFILQTLFLLILPIINLLILRHIKKCTDPRKSRHFPDFRHYK